MAKAQGKKAAAGNKGAAKKVVAKVKNVAAAAKKKVAPKKASAPKPKKAAAKPAPKPAKPAKKAAAKVKAVAKAAGKAAAKAVKKAAKKAAKAVTPKKKAVAKPKAVKSAKPVAKPAPKAVAAPNPAKPAAKAAAPKAAEKPAKAAKPAAPAKAASAPKVSTPKAVPDKAAPKAATSVAPAAPAAPAPPPAAAAEPEKKRGRRARPRITSNGAPAAAWLSTEKPRPASFIPAPPRAEAPSAIAAPPASSDRLIREEDLTAQVIRTVPVRIDVEQSQGRFHVLPNPVSVTVRRGEGIEWDFRYIGGADFNVEEIVIEFAKPAPFAQAVYKTRKPGGARPHRQITAAVEGEPGSTYEYTITAMTPFMTSLATGRAQLIVA